MPADSTAASGRGPARRARLLTHPLFSIPAFGRNHPLSIRRHAALLDLIGALDWLEPDETIECPLPGMEVLARFHDRDYLRVLQTAAAEMTANAEVRERYNIGTMECPLFPGLWDRARATVGGSIEAAHLALQGQIGFHPAGGTHHGRRDRASGFCYFNDPVFSILTLLDAGLSRVLYVDLDAHHGDGVEDAFADDPRVFTLSIHEAGRWPGTGALHERRLGQARNLPVPKHLNDSELAYLIDAAVLPVARVFEPEAVVITCGVDALAGDPLSSMELSSRALCDAVEAVLATAPRGVVLGGGGYNPWILARCWTGLWGRLSGRAVDVELPDLARRVLADLDCDLIDAEDRDAAWLTALWDAPRPGPVRDELRAIASATRRP